MIKFKKLFQHLVPRFIKHLINPVPNRVNNFVISAVNEAHSGNLVLDAGAGECRFKAPLKNKRYFAIDAAWGDPTWSYSGLDVVGNLDSLPFESNVFDCIICTQVLEHVQEPQIVLNEFFRILKQDGVVCITAPQGGGVHQAPHDYFRFTCYGFQYLLEKAGFIEISIKPICGYFGYLANRFTFLPKALFWHIKNRWLRLIMFPIELLSYFLFVLVFPIILNAIDFLDHKRDFTLNYLVKCEKPKSIS